MELYIRNSSTIPFDQPNPFCIVYSPELNPIWSAASTRYCQNMRRISVHDNQSQCVLHCTVYEYTVTSFHHKNCLVPLKPSTQTYFFKHVAVSFVRHVVGAKLFVSNFRSHVFTSFLPRIV